MVALEKIREDNPSQHVMVDAALIALNTGMRIGEVCGLSWNDIDGGPTGDIKVGGQIHVNNVVTHPKGGRTLKPYPKSGEHRDIPLHGQLVGILMRRWNEVARDVGDDLSGCYVVARDATPAQFVSTEDVSRQWMLLVSLVGVKGVQGTRPHFHDLRHTFATQGLTHGFDVVTVASILGHKNTSTTLRHYARWMPNANAKAMRRMGELMSAGALAADED